MAGRPKAIQNPEQLWQLFTEYRTWVQKNPITIEDYVGKDADRVMREKPRPLTFEGYENFIFEKGIIYDLGDYSKNKNESYAEFSPILTRIKQIIRQNQIEGGMAGIYNPSITARLNGLTEKVQNEITTPGSIVVTFEKDTE